MATDHKLVRSRSRQGNLAADLQGQWMMMVTAETSGYQG